MRRATLFLNGVVTDYDSIRRWVSPADYLIGVDGGTRHCQALGLQPAAIIGDLDSLSETQLADYLAAGVVIERHSPIKDQTDLELAIEFAIRQGASEVLLLGALGGRLDQMLANVLILARHGWPIPILLADGNEFAQILRAGERLTLRAPVGSTVSVLALSERVTGLTYCGLAYPLTDFTLELGSSRGVSNVVADIPAEMTITDGVLLVIETLPPDG